MKLSGVTDSPQKKNEKIEKFMFNKQKFGHYYEHMIIMGDHHHGKSKSHIVVKKMTKSSGVAGYVI
jgi:hypothetical protein